MNQIMENIKSRRSRRAFLDKNIPDGIIEEIIEAGRYAPSALNKQPWKFIVVTDRGCIKRLSDIVKETSAGIIKFLPMLRLFKPPLRDPQTVAAIKKTVSSEADTVFYSAPLLIIITSEAGLPFASRDCSLASQNMMLYAHSVGIGSCFIGRADLLMMNKAAKDALGLPPRHAIHAAVVFGYSPQNQDTPAIPQRRRDNIIKWVRL